MDNNENSKLKALSDISSIDISLEFDKILYNILKITCEAMEAHSGTIMLIDERGDELKMVASYGLPDDYIERVYEAPNIFEEPRDKPWYQLSEELGFSSQIFTPMKRGANIIGLLNVYMAQVHEFTDEEINFVTIAASQASSIVQNARMCRQLGNNLEEKIKEAYKELYDSEKYLRWIIDSSLDGIVVVDEQGRFEFANDAFSNIIGWPREEIIGQLFVKIIPQDAVEFSLSRWHEAQKGIGNPKIITKSGEIKHLYISYVQVLIKGKKKIVSIVKDVSEKKKLELSLKESEERYRDLFENAIDAMYINDAEGYIRSINKAGLKILGCSAEDVIGTHVSRWLTPESIKLTQESVRKRILGEPVDDSMIQEVITKSGKCRWLETRSRIIRYGDRIIGFHGAARDITEKMRLEQEVKDYQKQLEKYYEDVKKAEARYRDLFENANDSLYIYDSGGHFKEVNNTALELLGCTKEEIIGTHISKWITPESLKITQENLKRRIADESVEKPMVLEVICKNGEHRWLEIKRRLIKEGDRVIEVHGIGRDITEKRRLEQELIESEARYRDLFENADDPMFTIDVEGHFMGINRAGLEILGGTKEEIIGSHISRWLTPESFKIAQENVIKQISDLPLEQPVTVEVICKNGEHRWGEIRTRVIRDGDRITQIHGIARDVTEKRRLEQKLNEYHEKLKKSCEELIEADRIKTEFISNITHELLTPLTSIRGFTELIYDETTGKINKEQKKSLEIILRNSDRLIRLIKGLLDIANLEKNKLGLQFGLVSMNDILSKSAQDIQPQAKDKEITIIQNIKPLPRIWGDEEKLTQVIMNLLANAIKFTPQKGTITITAGENKNEIKISVTDTGIGIPADKLSRIFDRFYQIDGSASRRYGGIGLGLSICKSIIESHYGSIWAESDGSGSTFHLVLPKLEHRKKPVL